MQRLYCYIDETGQDTGSSFFWVVAVVSDGDQEKLRGQLEEIERQAGTGRKKWNKLRPKHRLAYLARVVERRIAAGDVFVGRYAKPLPYFVPTLETVAKAITRRATGECQVTVIIDGVDRMSARKYTNALRVRGIRLAQVRGRRDESEPMIRLADMWAGAVRAAHEGEPEASKIVVRATTTGDLIDLTA